MFLLSQDSSLWLGLTSIEQLMSPECSKHQFLSFAKMFYIYIYMYIYKIYICIYIYIHIIYVYIYIFPYTLRSEIDISPAINLSEIFHSGLYYSSHLIYLFLERFSNTTIAFYFMLFR